MARLFHLAQNLTRFFALSLALLGITACGNGGKIEFHPTDGTPVKINNRGAATTMVPASTALAIESGKTIANGYHAKLQFNSLQGTQLTGGGYTVKLKHTTRNR